MKKEWKTTEKNHRAARRRREGLSPQSLVSPKVKVVREARLFPSPLTPEATEDEMLSFFFLSSLWSPRACFPLHRCLLYCRLLGTSKYTAVNDAIFGSKSVQRLSPRLERRLRNCSHLNEKQCRYLEHVYELTGKAQ